MDRNEFLKNMLASRLFNGLTLEKMDEIISLAETRFYPSGGIVVKEHEPGDRFFWVASGRLEVRIVQSDKSNQILINHLKTGDMFGEMALIGIEKRTATVTAKDNSQLIIWQAASLMDYLKNDFEVGFAVMKNLSYILGSRLRDMNLMIRTYADALGADAVKYL